MIFRFHEKKGGISGVLPSAAVDRITDLRRHYSSARDIDFVSWFDLHNGNARHADSTAGLRHVQHRGSELGNPR